MGCATSKVDPTDEAPSVRGCTDVIWLCLYIGFWFLMILIAAFSFVYGNPIRLINGYDSFGNTCGSKNDRLGNMTLTGLDLTDKQFLLFFDIKDLPKVLQVCVKECPTKTSNTLEDLRQYYNETGVNLCRYDFDFNELDKQEYKDYPERKKLLSSPLGPCPQLPVYDSVPFLHRCVPRPVKEIAASLFKSFYNLFNDWDVLEEIVRDVYNSWKQLMALAFVALVLSIITVSILHLLSTLVSTIIMVLVMVSSIASTSYLWFTYYEIREEINKLPADQVLDEAIRNEHAFFWYALIATVITIVITVLMILMCKRFQLLADLFRETATCLGQVPVLFFVPIVSFIAFLIYFTFWIIVMAALVTSYNVSSSKVSSYGGGFDLNATDRVIEANLTPIGNISAAQVRSFTLVEFVDPLWVKYMWWVYFIGLIWTAEFIFACQSMVIAGAVAHWFYRTRYKTSDHVCYATCKLFKYHLGSVAKGSFLITLFKVPRLILTFLHEQLRSRKDAGSEIAKCCLSCCVCCFYCLEKFIRYLNHNAYTVIAIDGVNFCTAASTAFDVLASHSLEVAMINSLGDFILFLGKIFVTASTGIVGLYWFKQDENLSFYAAPTLVAFILAYFIAHNILSLYEMVLDTLYLCRCQNGDQMQVDTANQVESAETQVPTEMEPINEEKEAE